MQYTLTINLTGSTGNIVAAKQNVTLVKLVPGGSPVVWLAIAPADTITVKWIEQYSLYASTTNIQNGAQVVRDSELKADGGMTYTLTDGGFTGASTGTVPPASYEFANKSGWQINGTPQVTAGLCAEAVLDSGPVSSPISAVIVRQSQKARFTPIERISIYLSSWSDNGVVISEVDGEALEVDYTTNPQATVKYDGNSNRFVRTS